MTNAGWKNFLQLNNDKTEILVFCPSTLSSYIVRLVPSLLMCVTVSKTLV